MASSTDLIGEESPDCIEQKWGCKLPMVTYSPFKRNLKKAGKELTLLENHRDEFFSKFFEYEKK